MNVSKIVYPAQWVIDIYYYWSYLTLLLTWALTPLLTYTILTQSKNLHSFKWLILNHSFWCLAFETLMGLIKPLFLAPAPGGFPLGWLRYNGSFFKTTIATFLGFTFGINCVVWLSVTIGVRYLLVFPSAVSTFFSVKAFCIVAIGFMVILYALIAGVGYFTLFIDEETVHQWAVEFDPFFINFKEPSLFFCPMKYNRHFIIFVFCTMIILICTAIITVAYFIQLVKKLSGAASVQKMQRSLIVSSIAHIAFTFLFLTGPLTIIFANGVFETPNTATLATFCWCCLSTHSIIEFIVTLAFVSPYRKFVTQLFFKVFWCYSSKSYTPPMSINTSSSMFTRNSNHL